MNQSKSNKIVMINDHILMNLENVDRKDLDITLMHNGMLPLSINERKYLEALHDNLSKSTKIFQDLYEIMESSNDIMDIEEIRTSITKAIDNNEGVLQVKIDDIGRGFEVTKEEM